MNICSKFHEEVCFEDRKCPVCVIIEDKDRQIDELKDEVSSLKHEVSRLENNE
jgi:cell division protein FtsB